MLKPIGSLKNMFRTICAILISLIHSNLSIMCMCHGISFTPAEFVKHARATNSDEVMRKARNSLRREVDRSNCMSITEEEKERKQARQRQLYWEKKEANGYSRNMEPNKQGENVFKKYGELVGISDAIQHVQSTQAIQVQDSA
ncbi:hypothetical protein Syun_025646 [Stephania yunnanensis]|uniref:Tify domain-containing protein n=1 Tax=Stephania yunnanensis TaxID=152371 RepID=A0AAP0ES22_9MAGN